MKYISSEELILRLQNMTNVFIKLRDEMEKNYPLMERHSLVKYYEGKAHTYDIIVKSLETFINNAIDEDDILFDSITKDKKVKVIN